MEDKKEKNQTIKDEKSLETGSQRRRRRSI